MAEADLSKQLGTLRYLLGLRSARLRAEAAQQRAAKLEEGAAADGENPPSSEVPTCVAASFTTYVLEKCNQCRQLH